MANVVYIPTDYLKAVRVFALKDNSEDPMSGVWLEANPIGNARIVATNSYVIGVMRLLNAAEVEHPIGVIIPPEILDQLPLPSAPQKVEVLIGEKVGEFSHRIELRCNGVAVDGKSMEAEYPKYTSVIPHRTNGRAARYSIYDLNLFYHAWRILHPKWARRKHIPDITIGYNGAWPALVKIDHSDFIGVMNPVVFTDDNPKKSPFEFELPDWMYEDLLHQRMTRDELDEFEKAILREHHVYYLRNAMTAKDITLEDIVNVCAEVFSHDDLSNIKHYLEKVLANNGNN